MTVFLIMMALTSVGPAAMTDDPPAVEFFEKHVRPVLVENCHACHSAIAGKHKGGLRLDGRAEILKGGDNGPVIVLGQPERSRLIAAVKYGDVTLQMPPKGKLPENSIADLEAWIKAGAVWPSGTATGGTTETAFDMSARKQSHWCWQPVRPTAPPEVKDSAWPRDPVDYFVLARMESAGLKPSPAADPRTLVRRLTFDLTGLPPAPEEVEAFLKIADQPKAIDNLVDRLLASPRFGERWARHWLDLVRYAETRGHEFDYHIANAWQYRDYVIRALNADVPYDQFVREHIAGDLMSEPRLHPERKFNESILGTGFWWLGEQFQSPVDLKQDEADHIDNQIDVFGKTFLGLTVSCARCHEHKFDAISTKDYYALSSVLMSCGYRQVRFETDPQHQTIARQLDELRRREQPRLRRAIAEVLRPTAVDWPTPRNARSPLSSVEATTVLDFGKCRPEDWRIDGVGFGVGPSRVGDVRLDIVPGRPPLGVVCEPAAEADPAWDTISTPQVAQRDVGDLGQAVRAGRTIRTPSVALDGRKVYYRVRGQGIAYAAVQQHTMMEGPLHRNLVLKLDGGQGYRWIEHDLSRYADHCVHFEFTATSPTFAVSQVVTAARKPPEPTHDEAIDTGAALQRWADGGDLPAHAAIAINALIQQADEVTRKRLGEVVQPTVEAVRRLVEPAAKESATAAAMLDGSAVDGRVFVRGNPHALGEPVPRRFLEALAGPNALSATGSGRLELARQVTDPAVNPLIARVFVNRVWHHLFGRGIVASVDNFGVMGESPTHPELLDHLADRFVREGWSLKKLIRALVLTQTYQQASLPRADAAATDPQNRLLHRMNLKRLDGEAIRDALLGLSGRLDPVMYGPPVPVHLTPFMDGRGKPAMNGPLDGAGRRSIYLEVRRNFLPPFLTAFDTPTPFTTIGRRNVSNVPAQALVLLNDPFVREQARCWVEHDTSGDADTRIRRMYQQAFARPPTEEETAACRAFVARHEWTDLAHALVNVKEFIYLH